MLRKSTQGEGGSVGGRDYRGAPASENEDGESRLREESTNHLPGKRDARSASEKGE